LWQSDILDVFRIFAAHAQKDNIYELLVDVPTAIRAGVRQATAIFYETWTFLSQEEIVALARVFTGSIARSANLPVFSLLRGRF